MVNDVDEVGAEGMVWGYLHGLFKELARGCEEVGPDFDERFYSAVHQISLMDRQIHDELRKEV